MSKTIKKVWDAVSTVLVALVVLLAASLVGIRLFGLQTFSVLSGSMEPEYPTGSLIYVQKADYRSLEVGDVITFMINENTVVTHRIVRIEADNEEPDTLRFYTKGDANSIEDANPVHYKNVIGRAMDFSVPYLGYVAEFVQNPPGLYISIGIGAVLLILAFLPTGKKKDGERSV